MNYQEFINELKTNSECNFIAEAITVHQANSIDATIAFLEDNGVKLNGYVLMISHPTTGKVVTQEKFVNKNENIKYIDYENDYRFNSLKDKILGRFFPLFKNFIDKESNHKMFYIASPNLRLVWLYCLNQYLPNRNYKLILLEDGAGSYEDQFNHRINYIKCYYNNTYSLKYYIFYLKFCFYYFIEFINAKILEKKRHLIRNTIFLNKKEGNTYRLIRNEKMSKYYQDVFKKFGSNIPKEKLKIFENAALINTQPLKSNNITDGIIDFDAYRKVVEILNNLKIPVVIKPHPRELDYKKYEEFNCKIFNDNTCSQEAILANLDCKPKCIISIFSSTLLNATGIYGIPAISLAKIILKENINDVFVEQLKDFINRYKDFFFFPETYEELTEYLSNMK